MDTGVSFSEPHKVYLSDKMMENVKVRSNLPVELQSDQGLSSIGAVAKPLDNFDIQKETHSLFYLISSAYAVSPGTVDKHFSEYWDNIGDIYKEFAISTIEPQEFSEYLNRIQDIVETNVGGDTDVIIGANLIEKLTLREDEIESLLSTPNLSTSEQILSQVLNKESAKITRFGKYTSKIEEPEKIYFSIPPYQSTEESKEKLRKKILDTKFLVPDLDYRFVADSTWSSGPILRTEPTAGLLRATEESLEFTKPVSVAIPFRDEADQPLYENENIVQACYSEFQHEASVNRSSRDNIDIVYDNYEISLALRENVIGFTCLDAVGDQIEKVESRIRSFHSLLEDKIGNSLPFVDYSEYEAHGQTTFESFVLDTNAIYQQKGISDRNSIAQFLTRATDFYQKEIIVPWETICELNRHKDKRTSTQEAAKQGVKNLNMLQRFSNHGFVDVTIEDLPDKFDNVVHEQTGATDLGIVRKVDEKCALITDDDHLRNIADIYGRNCIGLDYFSRTTGNRYEQDTWSSVEEDLKKKPLSEETVEQNVTEILGSIQHGPKNESPDSEAVSSKKDELIKDWTDNKQIIVCPTDGKKMYYLSETVDVVPSYGIVDSLSEHIVDVNSNKMLTSDLLENVRASVGGLGKSYRPFVNFLIPEEFVHQSQGMNRINKLHQLRSVTNAGYASIKVDGDSEDLKDIAVRAAKQNDCILLSENSENLDKLANLLEVQISSV